MAESLKSLGWLEGIERAMGGSDEFLELPRSLFSCRLGQQPDHLVPARYLRSLPEGSHSGDSLFLNPQCLFMAPGEWPAALADSGLQRESFALDADIAWVPEVATGSVRPFWLSRHERELVDRLRAGNLAVADLPVHARKAWAAVGILMSSQGTAAQWDAWQKTCERSQREYAEKLYTPVSGLIHPFHLSALRRYYRFLIRTGAIRLGDDQSPRRFAKHNEPIAQFFHHQLTASVSAIAGEAVKPSYVYFASYQPGAVLEKHTDREQCDFSITLCVDYSPEPERATPWPIFLDTTQGRVTVYQGIGDALFYRGCQVPHERHALPQSHTSTSIFFHYVRQSFSGKLT